MYGERTQEDRRWALLERGRVGRSRWVSSIACGLLALCWSGCAANPSRIDGDETTGYAIYRTGRLGPDELAALCDLGVEELIVLDGTAGQRECRMRNEACSELRIRYDTFQDPRVPVQGDFLLAFDRWVEQSQATGRKIAIRCRHGWHRTGRLAAYYRIRFQGWQADKAVEEMLEEGRIMGRYPELPRQVQAMAEWLKTGVCANHEAACPRPTRVGQGATGLLAAGTFAEDVCEPGSNGDRG